MVRQTFLTPRTAISDVRRAYSSAVEHGIADPAVAGSIPAAPLRFFVCLIPFMFGSFWLAWFRAKKTTPLSFLRGEFFLSTTPNKKHEKDATPRGFEPLRAKPTHLAGERLNHSAKASALQQLFRSPIITRANQSKIKRQQQDLNLRGQSPSDFKSDSLTTRTCCHTGRVGRPGMLKCPSGAMDSASDF